MKLALFSTERYDQKYFDAALASRRDNDPGFAFDVVYFDVALNEETAPLAAGADAVCVFVNDVLSATVIRALAQLGVRAILLRCAGFNNVDLAAAEAAGIAVANVPSYSPEAVAEFAVALIQTLNRKTHRAYNRVREGNFALDGLLGMTLHGKTVGIVGTGKIGLATARIMRGFGCRILAHDPFPSPAMREIGEYKDLDDLLPQCDIISLHCPLMDSTRHIVNAGTIAKMKPGVMVVNTSRGGLLDTRAVIRALKSKQIGGLALDVYEGEGSIFYHDHSGDIIDDDVLMRLTTFPNVLVCGHQAFFTIEALQEIADCTLTNFSEILTDKTCKNSLIKGPKVERRDSLPVRKV